MTISDVPQKQPTVFDKIEKTVKRAVQLRRSFDAANEAALKSGFEVSWYPNDPRVAVILDLADGLIEYLGCPQERWEQSSKNLRFFRGEQNTLHMNFDMLVAGFRIAASLGVSPTDDGGTKAYWEERTMLTIDLGKPETFADFYKKAAEAIETTALAAMRNANANAPNARALGVL